MKVSSVATKSEKTMADVWCYCCQSAVTIRTAHVLTIQVISQHSSLRDIPNFIFAGFNVRSFCRSAAIHEYFACEYLDITVNGHVHSSSQSMTSCVTKMAVTGQPYFASSFFLSHCICCRQRCLFDLT